MNDKLLIGLLGNKGSGRSFTWETLFGHKVHTGKYARRLFFNQNEFVDVFLINGSPNERKTSVEKLIPTEQTAKIILCSFDYSKNLKETFRYFLKNNFTIFVQWLKPGYNEEKTKLMFYTHGIVNFLLSANGIVCVRDANQKVRFRTREILDFIYGWAKSRDLIQQL